MQISVNRAAYRDPVTVADDTAERIAVQLLARGKARGVKLGRKFKLTPHQRKEVLARRDKGETLMDIASNNSSVSPTPWR